MFVCLLISIISLVYSWINYLLEDSELGISTRLKWLPRPILFAWRFLYCCVFFCFPRTFTLLRPRSCHLVQLPFPSYYSILYLSTMRPVPGTLLISPFPGEHLWLFIPLCLFIFSSLCLECPSLMLGNSCFLFGSPNAIFCEADFHFLLWASRILYTCLFCRPYYIVLTWFVCISLYSTELWLFEGKDHKMLRVFKKLLNEQMLLNQLKRISVMVLGRHTRARHPSKSVYCRCVCHLQEEIQRIT